MHDVLSFFSWFFHGVRIKNVFFFSLACRKKVLLHIFMYFLKLIAVDQCKLVISL